VKHNNKRAARGERESALYFHPQPALVTSSSTSSSSESEVKNQKKASASVESGGGGSYEARKEVERKKSIFYRHKETHHSYIRVMKDKSAAHYCADF
jgi:hypothetical protein